MWILAAFAYPSTTENLNFGSVLAPEVRAGNFGPSAIARSKALLWLPHPAMKSKSKPRPNLQRQSPRVVV